MVGLGSLTRGRVQASQGRSTAWWLVALTMAALAASCGGGEDDTAESALPAYPVGDISTVAGTGTAGAGGDGGPATSADIYAPAGVASDGRGNLYVSGDNRIRRVDAETGVIVTFAGTGSPGFDGDDMPAAETRLDGPGGLAVDDAGDVYVADTENQRIRKIDGVTGVITTVAGGMLVTADMRLQKYTGDGMEAAHAYLPRPLDVAIDPQGNLYIADADADSIRRVDAATGVITTVAGGTTVTLEQVQAGFIGDGGLATQAVLNNPRGVDVDSRGNIYIADFDNRIVRRIDAATGIITSIARGGSAPAGTSDTAVNAFISKPTDVAVDDQDNLYIVADQNIIKFNVATGEAITVAGGGSGDHGDGGPATSGTFEVPEAMVVTSDGVLFIADLAANRIRKVTAPIVR